MHTLPLGLAKNLSDVLLTFSLPIRPQPYNNDELGGSMFGSNENAMWKSVLPHRWTMNLVKIMKDRIATSFPGAGPCFKTCIAAHETLAAAKCPPA
ncbi:MAG: hypothetical protein H6875_13325 [Hyphomicrobiaceae bacterium]|nr:hypothetical protein [Hyphomicrobiaceae bacterium]